MKRWMLLPALTLCQCTRPECSPADYRLPECRVIAENQVAQLTRTDGIAVRFQDPNTEDVDSWDAKGLVTIGRNDLLRARVGTLGDFRLTIYRAGDEPSQITMEVDNVHPLIPPLDGEISQEGLLRTVALTLDAPAVNLRGTLPDALCGGKYRIAAVGDIQTNPVQFSSILEDLQREASEDIPLLGLLLLGDVAENGTREEMIHVRNLMAASPVPIAVTPGNHDVYAEIASVYNETFGPGNMAFDVCDTHVLLLDTGNGDLASTTRGRFPELMENDRDFFIAGMHYPPYPALSSSGWTAEDQAQHLMAELTAHDADLMLAGHWHRRRQFEQQPPLPQIVVGTGGATQYAADPDYGYLRMTFGDQLDTCFIPVPPPGGNGEVPASREPANCPGFD